MKWIRYVEYILLAICVVVFIMFLVQGEAAVGLMLNWMYIIFGLAVLVALFFPIINLFTNPKGAVKTLIGLVVVVALLFLCYSLAKDAPIPLADGTSFDNSMILKLTDTGLYVTYLAFVGAVLAVIFGEVRNLFTK